MVVILQITFSNAFCKRKWLYFHWNFTKVCSQGFNWHEFSNGSGTCKNLAPSHCLNQWWQILFRLMSSLGRNESTHVVPQEIARFRPLSSHDDVIKWKHFPHNWPFVRGIHRSPVNSLHKGQWRGALMFSLICGSINDWVNNREAGDFRRYRAHYDVIVMILNGVGSHGRNRVRNHWQPLWKNQVVFSSVPVDKHLQAQ